MSTEPAASTPARLPRLVILRAKCGNCYQDVSVDADGNPSCPSCLIGWDAYSEDATPEPLSDRGGEACGATYPNTGRFPCEPCTLPAGHTSRHFHTFHAPNPR